MARALTLYHAYTACTRVTLTALEQVGVEYADQLIDFRTGENRTPQYLAVSPQGKVPCLLVDGMSLTENGAILRWLHDSYPDAGLFPRADNAWDEARHISALLWVASTWHPTVRAVKVPFMWTTGDTEPVRAHGELMLSGLLDQLDATFKERPWFFGQSWSIIDTYLWWAYVNSEFGGFDLDKWPHILRHRAANEQLPQLQRALAREQAALDQRQRYQQ